ncbi:MAG: family N-acetyltransferase [Ferruginibacter sp.]|nr:family N-acetyltransferase [Ferruginibacter sp.]
MEITKVGVESIPTIQSLANTTWAVAYREILSEAQMSYMLDLIYSAASLQKQIEELGHRFIVASVNNVASGFASYSVKNKKELGIFKLQKIYVDPALQGSGIGKALLDFVISEIRPLGAKTLELNVNRHNKALGFYQKLGFVIIGEKDIPIGNGYFMNDFIMKVNV